MKCIKAHVFALATLVACVAPRVGATGENAAANPGQLTKDDYKFACEAARGGMFEVRAGEMARMRGSDPAVKQFGARMVADHSKADAQLKTIAASKGATLPAALDRKEQHLLEGLSKLSGRDFDRAYADSMVKDHRDDLKEFEKESERASDPDVKAFATTTAEVISHHLNAAQQMQAAVEGERATAR